MDSQTFQTQINTSIASQLSGQTARYRALGGTPEIITYLEHLQAVTSGGKRIRPYLTWSVLKHYSPDQHFENHQLLLVSVELFHVFCLIHDDVMDESDYRHGTQTMHAFAQSTLYKLAEKPNQKRTSGSQAILAGDILFNTVFKLFYEYVSTVGQTTGKALSETFHTLVDEVCLGQMIDIDLTTKDKPDEKTITLKNILKTARYSFVQPMALGVIVANRNDLLPFLSAFGEKIGLLYQIQDDMLDVIGDPQKTKKPLFQDVTQKQPTILSHHILAQEGALKERFGEYLGKPVSPEDQQDLLSIFEQSGALSYAQTTINRLEKELLELYAIHQLSDGDKAFFNKLVDLIRNRSN